MSELLRVVRADRRRHESRLIAQGTLAMLAERAALGELRSDDLVFGLSGRALLARDVAELAAYVPCKREAALTLAFRSGLIGAALLLPIVLVVVASIDLDAVLASLAWLRDPSAAQIEVILYLGLPLAAVVHALLERRRLRAARRARAIERVGDRARLG